MSMAAKSSKWVGLVSSNPSRVVDALGLGPTSASNTIDLTNTHGDTLEDFVFAMDAVHQITESFTKETGARRQEWEGLVHAGVAEALCRSVCHLGALNDASQRTETMSSFYTPFLMLYFAAMGFREPMSAVDQRVLTAVRDNWPAMMARWWNDPQNTLRQDDAHEPERLVVARLLGHLLIHDPSVYSIIFDPNDHTVAVIARHWAHCRSPSVARSTVILLRSITFLSFSENVEEYLKDHERPTLPFLLSKIYAGCAKQPTPHYLIDIMASRLAQGDQQYAVEDLIFCHDLYVGFREIDNPAFAEALRKSEPYWRNVFKLMRQNNTTHQQVSSSVMNLAVKVVIQKPSDECAVAIRTWIAAGLFDMLDATMPDLVQTPGLSRAMVFLFTAIKEAAHDFPPDVLDLLKAQLPRQKTAGAAIKFANEKQDSTDAPPVGELEEDGGVPGPESPIWNNGLWQAIGWLHGLCLDRGTCTRRGCGNAGVSNCSACHKFMYCGSECQKLDWKEHKQLCKFAEPFVAAAFDSDAGKKPLTPAKAAQMGLIDKEHVTSSVESNTTGYLLPTSILVLALVVAASYFGVFDELGTWFNKRTDGIMS
ncbi:hypothetical protein C8R43DRAFT_991047 [Mycena crocata]|nr:hypothetical protein C8R43DRAFT_991047 [Mycena crocata]